MAEKVRASGRKGKARRILLDILDIDPADRVAVDSFWAKYLPSEYPLDTSLLHDQFKASKELALLIIDATLSERIGPKARVHRAMREAQKQELTIEERRAYVVREIEIARQNFIGKCRVCLGWTSAAKCQCVRIDPKSKAPRLCGARTGLNVLSVWGILQELDERFSRLVPDIHSWDIHEEWVSCTLVAAKLSIKVGAFGDDERASKLKPYEQVRHVAKLFDLAYRKLFGCAPVSFEGYEGWGPIGVNQEPPAETTPMLRFQIDHVVGRADAGGGGVHWPAECAQ